MYEATVSVCSSQTHLLSFVKEQLAPGIKEIDGIVTELKEVNREYFSIACADTFRFQIQRDLSQACSEAISLGYKNVYMRYLLSINAANFYQNILVNTICAFDNEYDKQLISKVIDVEQPVYLDGYYNFKINSLKRKWAEIVSLVCENGYIVNDNEMILEFLQYLLESIPSKLKQLSITFENGDYTLFNSGNKVVSKLYSLAKVSTPLEEAMLNAICLKPQFIKVYNDGSLSKDFCDMLDALFHTKYLEE